jgi:putative FmdB family regulatory protein
LSTLKLELINPEFIIDKELFRQNLRYEQSLQENAMPTYDYECSQCGHRFEVFQSMSDEPVASCEKCSGPVKRLIGGGTGIIFKGSGFYVNDYKSGSASSTSPEKSPACSCCANNTSK